MMLRRDSAPEQAVVATWSPENDSLVETADIGHKGNADAPPLHSGNKTNVRNSKKQGAEVERKAPKPRAPSGYLARSKSDVPLRSKISAAGRSNAEKFVEPPENNEKPMDQKSGVKFKIMSLKMKGPMEYVPELFDEHKDQVAVGQILHVVLLDVDHHGSALEKLKQQLAEAEAELEARKKPSEDTGPKFVGEGLVIDEWKERRERYLA